MLAAFLRVEIWDCILRVARIREEFRLSPEHQQQDAWAVEAILMTERYGAMRTQLFEAGQKLTFADRAQDLAQWPDADARFGLAVAEAIAFVSALRRVMARPTEHPNEVESDWDGYFSSLRTAAGDASAHLDVAHKACLRHMRSELG